MDYQLLYQKVKSIFAKNEFTKNRFLHIKGVIATSLKLKEHYHFDIDEEQLKIASLLHDYGKKYANDELFALIPILLKEEPGYEDIIKCPAIWHSFIGASLIQTDFNISDIAIINAVKYHTTGVPQMDLLTKIIYVSDAIEPTRMFEDVDYYRKLAYQDFNQVLIALINKTIINLEKKGAFIHPLTYQTYQYFLKEEINER